MGWELSIVCVLKMLAPSEILWYFLLMYFWSELFGILTPWHKVFSNTSLGSSLGILLSWTHSEACWPWIPMICRAGTRWVGWYCWRDSRVVVPENHISHEITKDKVDSQGLFSYPWKLSYHYFLGKVVWDIDSRIVLDHGILVFGPPTTNSDGLAWPFVCGPVPI